jgi:hypothetical protein
VAIRVVERRNWIECFRSTSLLRAAAFEQRVRP